MKSQAFNEDYLDGSNNLDIKMAQTRYKYNNFNHSSGGVSKINLVTEDSEDEEKGKTVKDFMEIIKTKDFMRQKDSIKNNYAKAGSSKIREFYHQLTEQSEQSVFTMVENRN